MRPLALAAMVLTATAFAGNVEYDYPAEYAELFEWFRPLTGEEVKMLVSAPVIEPPGGDYAGSPILEPIFVKCVDGLPGHYWVLSYKGDDADVRKTAEDVISMLNAEDGFDPYELLKEYGKIKGRYEDFCTFFVYAWTWKHVIGLLSGTLSVYFLDDFSYYLDFAELELGKGTVRRARVYALSVRDSGPFFEFESTDGRSVYVYGHAENPKALTEKEVSGIKEDDLKVYYEYYRDNPGDRDTAKAKWLETLERINREAVREGGYYRLRD